MSLYYKHTLIPSHADYTPDPGRVRDFVLTLGEIGATPIAPALQLISDTDWITWVDGKPVVTPIPLAEVRRRATKLMLGRQGRNPATGELIIVPRRYHTLLSNLEELPFALDGLEQYEFELPAAAPHRLFKPESAPF